MNDYDTIAAISTPVGTGGISIVRLSGEKAFEITEKVFSRPNGKPFSEAGANTLSYGHIIDDEGSIVDEVLVGKMHAPHTYTTEDTAEINCHGGLFAARSVLALLLKNGARAAEPGEFTKRAFLGGRIDLSQAEAVEDIITSKTELFTKIAAGQIAGALKNAVSAITDKILVLLSELEVTIQYPEYDIEEVTVGRLRDSLEEIRDDIVALGATYRKGEISREGLRTVIAGKPNVGKSMLLNRILDEDKAIVTDIPGTTRDVVDELVNLSGVPVKMMDTAGIRESSEKVEAIGIDRSVAAIKKADLVLWTVDVSSPLEQEDMRLRAEIAGKPFFAVLNKCDLGINKDTLDYFRDDEYIICSARTGENIDKVTGAIADFAMDSPGDITSAALIVNARHKALIDKAAEAIGHAIVSLDGGMPEDLIEIDINDCRDYLGEITGETAREDVIDEIFSRFCLGK
ncbi:MAG: tRNA uridine-5-carboxymethylaminomethyl(34) synthesis GTPase MnmE [Eubacteriaceae bacterium]|nr:tRNA uridine-5-carboxymethylaminomethyl(34) synthesis GTPase MnmE [Eubacteriaceae bacterium]